MSTILCGDARSNSTFPLLARTTYNAIGETVYPPDSAPHQVLDLSCIRHLQSLTIEATVKSMTTFWTSSDGEEEMEAYNLQTPIPWIEQHLQTLFSDSAQRPQYLQRIVLELSFFVDKHALTRLDWEPLSSALRASQMWSLRSVQIRVVCCESTSLTLRALDCALRGDRHLSELVESGLLLIDTSQCSRDLAPVNAWWSF